jgi:hypothetical protein
MGWRRLPDRRLGYERLLTSFFNRSRLFVHANTRRSRAQRRLFSVLMVDRDVPTVFETALYGRS